MYYSLNSTAKPEISGSYPQIILKDSVFRDNKTPDYKQLSQKTKINNKINLDDFTLHTKSKVTDILSSDILSEKLGLIINHKTYLIFEQFLNEFTSDFPMSIKNMSYHFIHVVFCTSNIDFSKSVFIDMVNQNKPEKVKNLDEYYKRLNETYLKPQKIRLINNYDIFRLPFDRSIIISERFKDKLINNSVTGIEIKSYTNFDITTL